jgi:hypothetical protein
MARRQDGSCEVGQDEWRAKFSDIVTLSHRVEFLSDSQSSLSMDVKLRCEVIFLLMMRFIDATCGSNASF